MLEDIEDVGDETEPLRLPDYSAIRGALTEPYDYKKQRTLFDDY